MLGEEKDDDLPPYRYTLSAFNLFKSAIVSPEDPRTMFAMVERAAAISSFNQNNLSRSRLREQLDVSHQAALNIPTNRVLTTLGLAAITYFTVCGGPVGTETVVSSGGPLPALIGHFVFPLLVSIPIIMVITELATAFPDDGGYTVWVLNAFGPFWSFQEGYWSFVASITYRISYIEYIYGNIIQSSGLVLSSSVVVYLIKAAMAIVLCLPGFFGTRSLVRMLLLHGVLLGIPYMIMTVWGFTKMTSWAPFLELRGHSTSDINTMNATESTLHTANGNEFSLEIDWSEYIRAIFWTYDGFYLSSVFGGEVSNPARTYPRAMAICFGVTWLSYVLPMFAAIGADSSSLPWQEWEEDMYPDIAESIGGSLLYSFVIFAATIAICGMYMAELFCEAYQIRGMSECGLISAVFSKRDRKFGTPRNAIYFSLLFVLIGLAFDIDAIVCITDAITALVELFIIIAAIKLRTALPFISRPVKLPGGLCGMIFLLLLPTAVLCFLIVDALLKGTAPFYLCGTMGVGVFLWFAQKFWQEERTSPRFNFFV